MDSEFIQMLKSTVEDLADDDGWAFLAEVGALIMKKKPDFDPRNFGFAKLTPLIKALDEHFEVDEKVVENTHIKHIYVKIKD
jgi:Fe-S-cluster formation regulator IscX/YfhJ